MPKILKNKMQMLKMIHFTETLFVKISQIDALKHAILLIAQLKLLSFMITF